MTQQPTFLYHQLVRKCEGCGRVVPEASEDCPTCGRPWRCQVVDFETFRLAQEARANTPASPASIRRPARRTLVYEGPWARHFLLPNQTLLHTSKFQDRTAAITLKQLQDGWPRWSPQVRREFTLSCSWLHEQDDFPDMLRFILVVGDAIECSHIASLVATWLPTEEAHHQLSAAMERAPPGLEANFIQAIGIAAHPSAMAVLERQLERLLFEPDVLEADPFPRGLSAVLCVKYILDLGAPPSDYEERIRRLASHPASVVRSTCRRELRGHFSWLDNSL